MKNEKFLKKLTAAALGLGLGASSMASVGAMSPKSLWENHIQNESQSNILRKYYPQIRPELNKNLSSSIDVDVADFFLDGKIPELSTDEHLDPLDAAIVEAHNVLNGKHLDQNDDNATVFKEYLFQKLLAAQAKIIEIKNDVQNKTNDLKKNQTASLDFLNKYSNNPIVKQKIDIINACKQNCLELANQILNTDASLGSVNEWKKYFDLSYTTVQKNTQDASMYISDLTNMQSNNFNHFNFPNMQRNNFSPLNLSNMQRNNFNHFNFSNMPGNTAAPTPMIQNQINSINNEQEKEDLKNRFKRLSSGNQQIAGPCWLYATTTAINEFRDRTNSGSIIKRASGNYSRKSPVELAYENAGFKNPLSINAGGINGKRTQDILDYARKQGLEARQVLLFEHGYLGMSKNELVKFTADLLKEHFKYQKSPVLVEAPWSGSEFHELTIAGVSGNELLIVNSIGDNVEWQPIEKLSDYCKYDNHFSLVFFGSQENQNSEHECLPLSSMENIDYYNRAKNNLLEFARGNFNMKSLR